MIQFFQADPFEDITLKPYCYTNNPELFTDPTKMYEDEASANKQKETGTRLGYYLGDVYKSGKNYLIAGADRHYKDTDFETTEDYRAFKNSVAEGMD